MLYGNIYIVVVVFITLKEIMKVPVILQLKIRGGGNKYEGKKYLAKLRLNLFNLFQFHEGIPRFPKKLSSFPCLLLPAKSQALLFSVLSRFKQVLLLCKPTFMRVIIQLYVIYVPMIAFSQKRSIYGLFHVFSLQDFRKNLKSLYIEYVFLNIVIHP